MKLYYIKQYIVPVKKDDNQTLKKKQFEGINVRAVLWTNDVMIFIVGQNPSCISRQSVIPAIVSKWTNHH